MESYTKNTNFNQESIRLNIEIKEKIEKIINLQNLEINKEFESVVKAFNKSFFENYISKKNKKDLEVDKSLTKIEVLINY
jgi:hypothetical protein